MVLFAVLSSNLRIDPEQANAVWNDGAILIGSTFAASAAFVTGLLLWVVAARRLVDLTSARAVRALGVGIVGGPIIVFVIAALIAGSSASGGGKFPPFLIITVPTLIAIGVTLLAALGLRR